MKNFTTNHTNSHAHGPLLSVSGLSCSYATRAWGIFGKKEIKPVLNDVNFEISKGEIFGLTGESGCGKSTLVKCILGQIGYQGEIIIKNRKWNKNPDYRERRKRAFEVQAVFQNSGASLNPVKTIGWILEEPLKVHNLGAAAERRFKVDYILDQVGLDSSYKKRKPHELSTGQKQRVSIGAALMLNPSLIIADEPVSALDVSVGAQILNLFRELNHQTGLTLFFISHNQDQVCYLCNCTALLENGRIIGQNM